MYTHRSIYLHRYIDTNTNMYTYIHVYMTKETQTYQKRPTKKRSVLDIVPTRWRRLIGSHIFIGQFPQK